jgi:hypothetical protein
MTELLLGRNKIMLKKSLVFLCVFIFSVSGAFANIALPVQEPPPSGDVFMSDQGLAALRLEQEKLVLDLTRRAAVFSRARYTIRNTGAKQINTDLIFVTPFADKVRVFVNSTEIEVKAENIPLKKLPWKPAVMEGASGQEMPAYGFKITFTPNEETIVEVVFLLPSGYDNRDPDIGFYPGEAAHALNWSAAADSLAWYIYNLESASTFPGGLRQLDVEILIPGEDTLSVNMALAEKKTAEGFKSYTGSFQGMPVPYIEAKVRHQAVYNMIGASFGGGLVTDYDEYTEFMAQAMFDFYFYNHQISAGVEGNPLGTGLKFPIMYTYIFGGKMNSYIAFWGDLRLAAGVLFDLSPVSAVGFRFSAGLRLTLMILEIAYDFYLFDTERGYLGRMTFLYKVSI